MNILSGQRKWVLVGILVIIGGAAFVFLDPFDLDLLGSKPAHVAAQPAAKPSATVSVAKPPVAAPKAIATPTQAPMPATASSAPSAPKPAVAVPAVPAVKPPVAPQAAVTPTQATAPAAPSQPIQPPLKLAQTIKTAKPASGQTTGKPVTSKPERAKNLDLRHCLDMESDAAIAKCAGE